MDFRKTLSGFLALFIAVSSLIMPVNAADDAKIVNPTEATVIGASSFIWSSANDKKDNENAYDNTISMTDWGGVARTAEVELYVEKTGTYTLDVNAVIDLALDGASPLKFSIDGGSQTKLTSSNATVSELATPWTVNGWRVKNIAYKGEVELGEGNHTLTLEFPKRSIGDVTIYVFDCATITPVNIPEEEEPITVNTKENTTIGASSFEWSSKGDVKDNENAYDKTVAMASWGGVVRTAEATLYVEKAGRYSVDVNAVIDLTLDGASPMNISFDGGEKVTLSKSNTKVSDLENPWTAHNWTVKNIAYTSDFVLDEGLHTLTLEFPMRKLGDAVIYVFDCLKLVPPEPNQVITDENNVLEFENFYQSGVVESNGASGGYIVDILQYSATERIIEMVFDLETSGEYTLVMDATVEQGISGAQTHISPAFISVNGGDEIEISNNKQSNFSITGDATYENPQNWIPSRITLAQSFNLTEGENTITVRVAARKSGDMVVGVFDCIRLARKKNIESITADIGNGILKRGESASIKMKNQNGETVTVNDFSQITFTSTDTNIAKVTNGILKAKNYGKARIKIEAVANDQSLETEFEVNVVSEKGIWIASVERTGSGIKVNISAEENYIGGDVILAGVYGKKGDVVTSLKSTGTATTEAMDEDSEISVEVELSDVGDSDVIRVFLIDADNSKRTIYTKLTYGGTIE